MERKEERKNPQKNWIFVHYTVSTRCGIFLFSSTRHISYIDFCDFQLLKYVANSFTVDSDEVGCCWGSKQFSVCMGEIGNVIIAVLLFYSRGIQIKSWPGKRCSDIFLLLSSLLPGKCWETDNVHFFPKSYIFTIFLSYLSISFQAK